MPTCWFCGEREADPACTSKEVLYWVRKEPPVPVLDEIIRPTKHRELIEVQLPRCRQCRSYNFAVVKANLAGLVVGLMTPILAFWAWATASPETVPRIDDQWSVPAAFAAIGFGCIVPIFFRRWFLPPPPKHPSGEHPSVRKALAAGWMPSPGA